MRRNCDDAGPAASLKWLHVVKGIEGVPRVDNTLRSGFSGEQEGGEGMRNEWLQNGQNCRGEHENDKSSSKGVCVLETLLKCPFGAFPGQNCAVVLSS